MEMRTIEQGDIACAGCGLCVAKCPQNAIDFMVDEEGFKQPKINHDKCIECGICINECILYTSIKKQDVEKVYAAFSLDEEVRYNSTSGGLFTELASYILKSQDAVVIGAAYQTDFSVKHEIIDDILDIKRLRQSKYVQSDMSQIYSQVDELKENIVILFVGTPCQTVAFSRYMRNKKNPVIYVDFICRGVNSTTMFQAYLKELEECHNSRISSVWFKNKEEGWNQFQTRIDFQNGDSYGKDRYNDAFMRGFLKHNLYMRNSCYECQFKGQERIADITLADFWGISFANAKIDVENGVSAVIVRSEDGQKLFDAIRENIYCEEKDIELVRAGNACMDISVRKGNKRKAFYARMIKERFSEIIWSMEDEE